MKFNISVAFIVVYYNALIEGVSSDWRKNFKIILSKYNIFSQILCFVQIKMLQNDYLNFLTNKILIESEKPTFFSLRLSQGCNQRVEGQCHHRWTWCPIDPSIFESLPRARPIGWSHKRTGWQTNSKIVDNTFHYLNLYYMPIAIISCLLCSRKCMTLLHIISCLIQ